MRTDLQKVLIRCDATPEIGFGHVVRCLALADELRDSHGCRVDFAMLQGPQGVAQVHARGYDAFQSDQRIEDADEGEWLQELIAICQHQVLILDVRTDLTTEAVQSIRESGVLIVGIDDSSDRRLHADLAFYPPVPQVERMDWNGFTGQYYVGWDWILMRPQFAEAARRTEAASESISHSIFTNQQFTLLITMGGSDPAGFTLMALKAVEQLDGDIRTVVVLGSGFVHEDALANWLITAQKPFELLRDVSDMAPVMLESNLAIASMGVTAYELAMMRVPSLYLCLTEDHLYSCTVFQNEGFGQIIGMRDQVSVKKIATSVQNYLDGYTNGEFSECRVLPSIDGFGVRRIAWKLVESWSRNICQESLLD